MWRGIGLVAIAVAMGLAIACGGGGGSSADSQACPFDPTHPPAGQQQMPAVSLEEGRKRAQFELAVPNELPLGVRVADVLLYLDPNCPEKRVRIAELRFAGTYQFTIMESENGIGVGGPAEAIRVNGHTGDIQRSFEGRRVSIQWTDRNRGYSAIASLSDRFSEDRFLQILESIPE
jgi:hypothetical protein